MSLHQRLKYHAIYTFCLFMQHDKIHVMHKNFNNTITKSLYMNISEKAKVPSVPSEYPNF